MSMRATLASLLALVLLCAGGVYMVYSHFSRDAQMRDAELAYNRLHAEQIAQTQAAHASRMAAQDGQAPSAGAPAMNVEPAQSSADTPEDLADWYADAGASNEPFDPTPEDNSWLINDAQPTL